MLSFIKLWLPSAASILLLSIELPLVAFLMLGKPIDIIGNYAIAIAYIMFSNAIIYPITPFVVKNGNNLNSLKWSGVIVFSVFLFLNAYLFLFVEDSNVREVSHLFSISLIFIGLKRYLQACLIINKYTISISLSAFVRVFLTCTLSVFFLNQNIVSRYDILVVSAILFGGFIEVSILGCSLLKRKITLIIKDISNVHYKENILSYTALVLLSASYLATNLLMMKFFQDNTWITQYWTMIFTLSSISIYPLLDIDSIFIKMKQEYKRTLFHFGFVASVMTSVFSILLLFIVSIVIKEESIIAFICTPHFIISFLFTPFLWSTRSLMRVENVLYKKHGVTIVSILSAFILSFYLGKILSPSPVTLFNLIILLEIIIYFIYNRLIRKD